MWVVTDLVGVSTGCNLDKGEDAGWASAFLPETCGEGR